jgi:hypothetical protein
MNFKTFIACCTALPAWQSVLGQGNHGIGKSQLTYQLAQHFGLEVVERRLSQLTEGDMIGLPVIQNGATTFMPPDWILDCCRNPRLLFLDELNRATPEVMQAVFQICLDREIQGHKLHPDTRVYAMINTNSRYNVNAMDPALLDRFFAAELEPTVDDWLSWAEGKVHYSVVDFIKQSNSYLDGCGVGSTGKIITTDPNKVGPSRRSWDKLSKILTHAGMFQENVDEELFFGLCVGLLGNETSIQFQTFYKNMDAQISAIDILENYGKIKKKLRRLGQERMNVCIEKLAEWALKEKFTKAHVPNLKLFASDLPGELKVALWSKLTAGGTSQLDNIKLVHSAMGPQILEAVNSGAIPAQGGAAGSTTNP